MKGTPFYHVMQLKVSSTRGERASSSTPLDGPRLYSSHRTAAAELNTTSRHTGTIPFILSRPLPVSVLWRILLRSFSQLMKFLPGGRTRPLRPSDKRLSTLLRVNQIAVSSNGERARSDIEWRKVLEHKLEGKLKHRRHETNKGFDDFENGFLLQITEDSIEIDGVQSENCTIL